MQEALPVESVGGAEFAGQEKNLLTHSVKDLRAGQLFYWLLLLSFTWAIIVVTARPLVAPTPRGFR